MDATRTPAHAGLMANVAMAKAFVGREALADVVADGADEVLVGFVMEGRRAGRCGHRIVAGGEDVGVVTSGSLGPSLGVAVGMGYVRREHQAVGTQIEIDAGRQRLGATVSALGVYDKGTVRMKVQGF
jgi:aminomethyltransferase